MPLLALIALITAAVCEFAAGLNVQIKVGGQPLSLMPLGFGFLIAGVWLLR